MCCPLVFEFSVGIRGFVIGLGQISFFFSLYVITSNSGSQLQRKFTTFRNNMRGLVLTENLYERRSYTRLHRLLCGLSRFNRLQKYVMLACITVYTNAHFISRTTQDIQN